jgi:hypothetical protein
VDDTGAVLRRINWVRLGGAVAVALAFVMIIYGFSIAETGVPRQNLPQGLEAISPAAGATEQRQTEIVADFAPEYEGALVVNGVRIPPDQLRVDEGQSLIAFQARQGADVEEYLSRTVSVTVIFWKIADGEGSGSTNQWTWSFNVS